MSYPSLRPKDKFEARLMYESGVEVNVIAAYLRVSRATVLRALAELRAKLGAETRTRRAQFARNHLRGRGPQGSEPQGM